MKEEMKFKYLDKVRVTSGFYNRKQILKCGNRKRETQFYTVRVEIRFEADELEAV